MPTGTLDLPVNCQNYIELHNILFTYKNNQSLEMLLMPADTNLNLHNIFSHFRISELYLIFDWIQIRKYESKINCITESNTNISQYAFSRLSTESTEGRSLWEDGVNVAERTADHLRMFISHSKLVHRGKWTHDSELVRCVHNYNQWSNHTIILWLVENKSSDVWQSCSMSLMMLLMSILSFTTKRTIFEDFFTRFSQYEWH